MLTLTGSLDQSTFTFTWTSCSYRKPGHEVSLGPFTGEYTSFGITCLGTNLSVTYYLVS